MSLNQSSKKLIPSVLFGCRENLNRQKKIKEINSAVTKQSVTNSLFVGLKQLRAGRLDGDRKVSGRKVTGDARGDMSLVPRAGYGREHMEVLVPA